MLHSAARLRRPLRPLCRTMSKLITRNVIVALTAGCLIVLSASDVWAQRGGSTRPGAGQGGGQAGGGGGTGIGAVGGTTEPSGAITGELSRSADRMLSDAGEQAGTAGAAGLGGLRGIGGMGGMGMGMGGFGGMSPFGASPFGANTAAQTPSVRVRLRGDIQVPAQPPLAVQSRVQRQVLGNSPIRRRVNGMSVSVLDGVATISGTARSEQDRRMAELVLRLEPGVRQINNQIVVAP